MDEKIGAPFGEIIDDMDNFLLGSNYQNDNRNVSSHQEQRPQILAGAAPQNVALVNTPNFSASGEHSHRSSPKPVVVDLRPGTDAGHAHGLAVKSPAALFHHPHHHVPLLSAEARPLLPHNMLKNPDDEGDEPDLTDLVPPFQASGKRLYPPPGGNISAAVVVDSTATAFAELPPLHEPFKPRSQQTGAGAGAMQATAAAGAESVFPTLHSPFAKKDSGGVGAASIESGPAAEPVG